MFTQKELEMMSAAVLSRMNDFSEAKKLLNGVATDEINRVADEYVNLHRKIAEYMQGDA